MTTVRWTSSRPPPRDVNPELVAQASLARNPALCPVLVREGTTAGGPGAACMDPPLCMGPSPSPRPAAADARHQGEVCSAAGLVACFTSRASLALDPRWVLSASLPRAGATGTGDPRRGVTPVGSSTPTPGSALLRRSPREWWSASLLPCAVGPRRVPKAGDHHRPHVTAVELAHDERSAVVASIL
jgi:hypothetical protein